MAVLQPLYRLQVTLGLRVGGSLPIQFYTINLRFGSWVSSSCWHTFENFFVYNPPKEGDHGRQREMLFTHSMLSMKTLTMHLVWDKAKVIANGGLMIHVVLETFLL